MNESKNSIFNTSKEMFYIVQQYSTTILFDSV